MSFQSTVYINQGFGVPGEVSQDYAWLALPYTLQSGSEPNVVGATGYTITSAGIAQAGSGGAYGFAGILGSPKSYASFGSGGVPLAPTLTLPNNFIGEIFTQGIMIVTLPAACNIGDYVLFNNTTGTLATMPPGGTPTSGFSFANAVVSQYALAGAGLAVIQLNPTFNPLPS